MCRNQKILHKLHIYFKHFREFKLRTVREEISRASTAVELFIHSFVWMNRMLKHFVQPNAMYLSQKSKFIYEEWKKKTAKHCPLAIKTPAIWLLNSNFSIKSIWEPFQLIWKSLHAKHTVHRHISVTFARIAIFLFSTHRRKANTLSINLPVVVHWGR